MALGDAQVHAIPGFFLQPDLSLFAFLLDETASSPGGDVAELGAYLGKSACLIGEHLHGATFTVVDLFGDEAEDSRNAQENRHEYGNLTRQSFERNYLSIHPKLPVVVRDFSHTIEDIVAPASQRFVHVDASHTYAPVARDIQAVQQVLKEDGVVVFDDYRMFHTPGVAAATWGAVDRGVLKPFALTEWKLYATLGDAHGWAEKVQSWCTRNQTPFSIEPIAGVDVVRLRTPPNVFPVSKVKQLVPPVAWEWLKRNRHRLPVRG
jgi:predicted O-methyltransferase YrrM